MTPATTPDAGSGECDGFTDTIFERADEPEDDGTGIRITRVEYELCAPDPLRLVVLLHWRVREQDGRPRTAEAIWTTLTELGIHGADDDTPVSLDEVAEAVTFLLQQGLVAPTPEVGRD
ncbi:hypothetical protein [Streptomyces cacaoi]|uniref:hypothetical protein n=1 Tax=Streptomyces cacaoi TaxID=1898 RepID=UPI0011F2BD52|nr:hypothetical protein [Streptomyces cacaoi]